MFYIERIRRPVAAACCLTIACWAAVGIFGLDAAIVLATEPGFSQRVLAHEPVAYWSFSEAGENTAPKNQGSANLSTAVQGPLRWNKAGPVSPEFPLFASSNRAVEFSGGSGVMKIADPGEKSPLDFEQGDSLTLAAWVAPEPLPGGGYFYIVGKGRTQNPGAPAHNQNYALRLQGKGSAAALSFLFRSAAVDGQESQWHRWTSSGEVGGGEVSSGDGWHQVVVTYTFGDPSSIRGYVDGRAVQGKWDMGGATQRAPVVDNDELWIGSSMGGQSGSTYRGLLDEVAIYRTAFSAEAVQEQFRYVRPAPAVDVADIPEDEVLVQIYEGVGDRKSWDFRPPRLTDSFTAPVLAFVELPHKYSAKGIHLDRTSPYLMRAYARLHIPPGKQRILLRSRNAARLTVDNKLVAETPFHSIPGTAHGDVFPVNRSQGPGVRPLQRGDTEAAAVLEGDGKVHLFQLEMIVGGQKHRPEMGETSVSMGQPGEDLFLLSQQTHIPLTNTGWLAFAAEQRLWMSNLNAVRRREASIGEAEYWARRHAYAREVLEQLAPKQPPKATENTSSFGAIDRFLAATLAGVQDDDAQPPPAELVDDYSFLRRLALDTVGRVPRPKEIKQFLQDDAPVRRNQAIDRYLESREWADHWVGYWQDVLAENPNIINPTLNNTGPFRWWIYESLLDNKPVDRFATELIMMEGSQYYGGPAGFAVASQNDAPLAAKAHIVAQAFLAVEMKCARCHDAPFHELSQHDLFSLAAMLGRQPLSVPASSSVPGDALDASSIVEVTLKPGVPVPPNWTFTDLMPVSELPGWVLRDSQDTREQAAALITSPHNTRFAGVMVNRLWRRCLGLGLVEPVDDWEFSETIHADLLSYLARELATHDYDLKHVAKLIFQSHAYQRKTQPAPANLDNYAFASPLRRRMTAEQLVDSMFVVAGKPFHAGPMNIDIDGARAFTSSLNLGQPTRSWMFASLSNERDRPSLALPFAQPFVTVLETFGWRSSRQDPRTVRDHAPNVLQPAILANGVLGRRVSRLSDDSAFTAMALRQQPLENLLEQTFLRVYTRLPNAAERKLFTDLLAAGYASRRLPNAPLNPPPELPRNRVAWSNHLAPEATTIKQALERAVHQGDPPTQRLAAPWRERMEDMLWALLNSPEFVFSP